MPSKPTPEVLRARNRFSPSTAPRARGIRPWAQWLLAAAGFATALAFAGCNSAEPEPSQDAALTVISPIGGSFKMSEKLRFIVKADYNRFSSGLNYQLSTDGGKTYKLMFANVRKEGVALDTLDWDPVNDPPGDVAAGQPLQVRVIDYDKKHYVISATFRLTN